MAPRPSRRRSPRTGRRAKLTRMGNSTLDFYLARAAQARDEADAATLDHVRERCRRSEAAWTELADRAARTARIRETILNEKAAEASQAE